MDIYEKFQLLGVENAPGQELRQGEDGEVLCDLDLSGDPVDFHMEM